MGEKRRATKRIALVELDVGGAHELAHGLVLGLEGRERAFRRRWIGQRGVGEQAVAHVVALQRAHGG